MITFEIFKKPDWEKYKQEFIDIENEIFSDSNLKADEDYVKECIVDNSYLTVMVFDNDKMIGNTVIQLMNQLTEEYDFEGYWNPAPYYDKNIAYVNSTAILESYQGKGIGKKLKSISHIILKSYGIETVMGHSHEGAMTKMMQDLGAVIVQTFENWFDTGETNYLYSYEIKEKGYNINRIIQDKEYNCGPISIKILMDYYKKEDKPVEYYESVVKCTEEDGTIIEENVEQFKEIGLIVNKECIFESLFDKLCIVNYQMGTYPHFSIVYGNDSKNISLYNTADGKEYLYSKEEFEPIWYSNKNGSKIIITL